MTTHPQAVGALAIDGGTPVRAEPFPPRRGFSGEARRAVVELLDAAIEQGNHVLGYNGPQEEAYCREFAELAGGGFADAVNSGTNALWVALRAVGVEPFSEVIVPAVSDPGGVMPVVMCNAVPVPADCAPGSYNVGAEQIAERLTERTGAIVVAHIGGMPADMDPILAVAAERGIPVIEDCAQSLGATYKHRPVGSMGTAAAFSTMFAKHLTSGGQGGVAFTRDEAIYWRIRRYADRGKPFGLQGAAGNVVASLTCNTDELHATIARAQLREIPALIERRRELAGTIARRCRESLRSVRAVTDPPFGRCVHGFLLLSVRAEALRVDKDAFVAALEAEGIPAVASYWYVPTVMPYLKNSSLSTRGRCSEWKPVS